MEIKIPGSKTIFHASKRRKNQKHIQKESLKQIYKKTMIKEYAEPDSRLKKNVHIDKKKNEKRKYEIIDNRKLGMKHRLIQRKFFSLREPAEANR